MPKEKDDKYSEACIRNICFYERIKDFNPADNNLKGLKLADAKHKIGVRASDSHWDERINKLLK